MIESSIASVAPTIRDGREEVTWTGLLCVPKGCEVDRGQGILGQEPAWHRAKRFMLWHWCTHRQAQRSGTRQRGMSHPDSAIPATAVFTSAVCLSGYQARRATAMCQPQSAATLHRARQETEAQNSWHAAKLLVTDAPCSHSTLTGS